MSEGGVPRIGRARARTAVLAMLLVVDALVLVWAGRHVQLGRRARYDEARRTTQDLARVLGANLEGTLHLVDFALREAKHGIELELAHGRTDPARIEPMLLRLYSQLPFVDAIRTTDAGGRIVHGAGQRAGPQVDVSDRDYFVRTRALPGVDMVISQPLVSRITGRESLVFARRLDGADGRFAGIVYAAVQLEQFTRVLSRVTVGHLGTVALRTRDFALVARFPRGPETTAAIGQRKVSPALEAALGSGHEEGTLTGASPVDGLEKVTAFRRVADGDFIVIVAQAADEFLEGWRAEVRVTLGASALFVLLTALGGWLALRTLAREQEALISEVKTLGGLLPICAHCKKVRDDKGYWNRIETYIRERSNAQFTHGICPDCERQFYGDAGDGKEGEPPDKAPEGGGRA